MARKIPAKLQAKWEAKLAAEGLAPLTTYSADAVKQRRVARRLATATAGEHRAMATYYDRGQKFLRRIELAHRVWQLHVEGRGRRDISAFLCVPEKVVRLVLARLHDISGLHQPSFGGQR